MALLEGARARRGQPRRRGRGARTPRSPASSSFYGLLAAEARGAGSQQLESLRSDPIAAEPPRSRSSARARRAARAEARSQLDLRPESQREWLGVVRGLDDDTLLLAAELRASRRPVRPRDQHRRAHGAAPRLRAALPRCRIAREFAAAARDQASTRRCCYGIARQESRFVPDIVSSAGAVGLMQLMPGTARWVAKQLGRTDYSAGADRATSTSTRSSARSTSSTGSTGSTGCRRSRPPPIMRVRAARRRGDPPARRSKARSGSRRSRSTRRATT